MVERQVDFGFYLNPKPDEVLLPLKYAPDLTQPGDMLRVFVYTDSEDRPVATTKTPKAVVGPVRISGDERPGLLRRIHGLGIGKGSASAEKGATTRHANREELRRQGVPGSADESRLWYHKNNLQLHHGTR